MLIVTALQPARAVNPVIEPFALLTGGAPPQVAASSMDACPKEDGEEMSLSYSRGAEIFGEMYVWHVYNLPENRFCSLLESPEAVALTGEEYALLESGTNSVSVPPDFVGQVWPHACDTLISNPSNPISFGVRVRSDMTAIPPTLASAPEYCIAFGDYLLHARQRVTSQSQMHYLRSYGGRPGSISSLSILQPLGGVIFPPNVERCEPFCYPTTPNSQGGAYFSYIDNPVAPLLGGAVIGYPATTAPPVAIGMRDGNMSPGTARAASFTSGHFTTINLSNTPVLPFLTVSSPYPLQVIDPLDPPIAVSATSSSGSGSLQFLLNGAPISNTLPNSQLSPGDHIVTVRRSDGVAASNKIHARITSGSFNPNNDPATTTLPESNPYLAINSTWVIQNPPPVLSTQEGVELWRKQNNGPYVRLVSNAVSSTTYTETAPMNTTYTYQLRKRYSGGSRVLAEKSYRGNNPAPQVVSVSPGQGATNVSVLAEFQVTFDQAVYTNAGWFSLQCGSMYPAVTYTGTGSTRTVRVQLEAPIPAGANCTATIRAAAITDLVNLHPLADYSWTFSASECDYAGWSAVAGSPLVGKPSDTPSVKRYSGPCGFQADAGGDYLVDNTPVNEISYKTRFYFYTGNRSGAADIFQARNGGTFGAVIYRVLHDGNNLMFAANGSTETRTVPVVDNRWYMVQLQWSAGAGTGSLTMNVTGAGSPTPLYTPAITGINNWGDVVEQVRLGLVSGSNNTVPNPVPAHFDAYEGNRLTLPSRLCRGDASNDDMIGAADRVTVTNEILGTLLASGQPDADEDGAVGAADRVILTNAILDGKACADM